jgi:hypothetical protein
VALTGFEPTTGFFRLIRRTPSQPHLFKGPESTTKNVNDTNNFDGGEASFLPECCYHSRISMMEESSAIQIMTSHEEGAVYLTSCASHEEEAVISRSFSVL